MRKRTFLNWFKIQRFLFGPKYKPYKPTLLHISKSVDANGNDLDPNDLMIAKNALKGLHQNHKNKQTCQYNFIKHECYCGMTLEKLKNGENCSLKNTQHVGRAHV